jgi:hypothetical protein
MVMESKQFGAIALQLFDASQVPGNALDTALEFRRAAQAMANGEVTLTEVVPESADDA